MNLQNFVALAIRLYARFFCRDVVLALGTGLVASGVASLTSLMALALSFVVDFKDWPTLALVFGPDSSVSVNFALIVLGIVIVIYRMKQLEQRLTTLFIYLKGYDNMEERFPIDVIPAKYRYGKAFHLRYDTLHKTPQGALEEIKRISGDIARYVESNAAVSVKIFVAGRAFVPLQYAAGRVLGTRPEFEVMDFDRETGRWHFLDELDDGERINLLDPANAERVKESRQAALVLPFTANISNEQLPEGLRDVVYRFELEKGPRQDSMASKEKMEAILITVNQCIRNLRAEVDVLHVFAAVSTSTAVRLGCLFQSNIYPETRVYQFDTRTGGYTWALRLLADKMEIVEDSSVLYQLNRV